MVFGEGRRDASSRSPGLVPCETTADCAGLDWCNGGSSFCWTYGVYEAFNQVCWTIRLSNSCHGIQDGGKPTDGVGLLCHGGEHVQLPCTAPSWYVAPSPMPAPLPPVLPPPPEPLPLPPPSPSAFYAPAPLPCKTFCSASCCGFTSPALDCSGCGPATPWAACQPHAKCYDILPPPPPSPPAPSPPPAPTPPPLPLPSFPPPPLSLLFVPARRAAGGRERFLRRAS